MALSIDPGEAGIFQWVIGGIGAIFTAAVVHLNMRLNRMEDRQEQDATQERGRTNDADNSLRLELRDAISDMKLTVADLNDRLHDLGNVVQRETVMKSDFASFRLELKDDIRGWRAEMMGWRSEMLTAINSLHRDHND